MKAWAIALLFFFPGTALAHGGIQRLSGASVVTCYPQPLAPLVNESFQIDCTISDTDLKSLPGIAGNLRLTEAASADPAQDREILARSFTTDENGSLHFSYTFPRSSYFDLELSYPDPSGTNQEVGFLFQPRQPNPPTRRWREPAIALAALTAGIALGLRFKPRGKFL